MDTLRGFTHVRTIDDKSISPELVPNAKGFGMADCTKCGATVHYDPTRSVDKVQSPMCTINI